MNITEALVLRNDVVLLPVTDLTPDIREKFDHDESDYTISRRHGRAASQIIDSETASLLQLFRTPRTIVDAVIENSRALAKDPEAWLDELLPHIGAFLQNGVLVAAGEAEESDIAQSIENGASVGPWRVLHLVNLIEDSEIYRIKDDSRDAALKIARAAVPFEESILANEEEVLRRLDGAGAPRVFDSGVHDGKPYLVIDWCPGADAGTAAAHRRHDRVRLLEIACGIADAYVELHARGVLHGDVHPRNVIIGDDGRARLIDFGLARAADDEPRTGRGGMFYFFEPELLAANRNGESIPTSFAGEQYAIAALLYLVIAGDHYLPFRYERDEMMRQVLEDSPLPFARRNVPPWPDVEAVLARALSKDPAARFPSTRDFASALRRAHDAAVAEALATPVSPQAIEFLEERIRLFSRGGAMFDQGFDVAPTASINYGSAGAAVGLLRIAEIRSDPRLLALADVWKWRALREIGKPEAYYNAAEELDPKVIGDVTPYHTDSGIHAAAALIAHARGDLNSLSASIERFIAAASRPCDDLDLTLGRSATLIGAALLLEVSNSDDDSDRLRRFGSDVMESVWRELDARSSITDGPAGGFLGLAHGWSGLIYAALRWCAASGVALPAALPRRLDEFASLRARRGKAAFWRRQVGGSAHDVLSGWCNGSAGHVFLFTAAHETFGDERFLRLAEEVGLHAAEEPMVIADLCCGAAGRGYAMLNLYRHTGDAAWLSRARRLANFAASFSGPPARANSLWKGELGVAVLIADLESPENARTPFFE